MHLNYGAINDHTLSVHRSGLTRVNIVDNTKVLCRQRDTFRLLVQEAILIKFFNPTLNRQDTGCARILKLYAAN